MRVIVVSNPWDIVILGCGQLGGNLKKALEAEKIHVLGVRRTLVPDESTFISLDLDVADDWERARPSTTRSNAVIVAIAPQMLERKMRIDNVMWVFLRDFASLSLYLIGSIQ